MSRSLRARMELLLTGNVSRQADKFGRDIEGMGKRGERGLTRLQRRAREVEDGMGRMARRAGALAGAFIGVQEVRRVMSLEERLERLGVNTGRSTEQMRALRASINEVAAADDIRVDPGQIIAGIESIAAATGDMDLAESLQREIGLAIQATGSGGAEIGQLISSISSKFDIDTPEGMRAALDLLAKQGKAGAIELSNLASLGPKVFSAYASVGKKGAAGLAEAGALMQIFKRGVGGPDQAATVFENVFNALSDGTKLKQLAKMGVEVRDAAGNILGPLDLIKNAVTTAGGDDLKLGSVFDAEAMRGFRQVSEMLRESGGFEELEVFVRMVADGKTLEEDSARMAQTANAAASSALTGVRSVVEDKAFAGPIQAFAAALRSVDKETVEYWGEIALAVAAIGGSYKLIKGGISIAQDLRGVAGAIGGQLGGKGPASIPGSIATAPVRVFVTNPGFGAGGLGGFGGKGGKGDKPGLGRGVSFLSMVPTVLAATTLHQDSKRVEERTTERMVQTGEDRETAYSKAFEETAMENRKGLVDFAPIQALGQIALRMKRALGAEVSEQDERDFGRKVVPAKDNTDLPPQPRRGRSLAVHPAETAAQPSRNRDIPKAPNPIRERLIERIIGGREGEQMGRPAGSFTDPLTGGFLVPQGPLNPLSTPAETSPELLDAVRDVVDGNGDLLTEMRDLNRALRSNRSAPPLTAAGDPYRMMGTGR